MEEQTFPILLEDDFRNQKIEDSYKRALELVSNVYFYGKPVDTSNDKEIIAMLFSLYELRKFI